MENGKEFWEIHCVCYLQININNVYGIFSQDHRACLKHAIKGRGHTPMITGPN